MSHSGSWWFSGHSCRNENQKSADSLKVDGDGHVGTAFVKFYENQKSNIGLGVDVDCYVDKAIVKFIFVDRLYKQSLKKPYNNVEYSSNDQ